MNDKYKKRIFRNIYTLFVATIFWATISPISFAYPVNDIGPEFGYREPLNNVLEFSAVFPGIEKNSPLGMQEKYFAQRRFADFRVSNSAADFSDAIKSAGVRELQLQLKRLGCYRGKTDGKIGPRTRAAFMLFSRLSGSDLALGGIRTVSARDAVSDEKNLLCNASWLLDNRPEELLGNWSFRADCPKLLLGIQITGELDLRKAGTAGFAGLATNSLGMSGKIEGQIAGKSVDTTINWPGIRISVLLFASNQTLSLSGVSSNGCDIVAWKSAPL